MTPHCRAGYGHNAVNTMTCPIVRRGTYALYIANTLPEVRITSWANASIATG